MRKRGNTKIVVSVLLILLALAGVFAAAESVGLSSEEAQQVEEQVSKVSSSTDVAETTKEYVKKFAEKRKVTSDKIVNVSEVDFETLPKEVNIENVDDTNLAIYEVEYNETDSKDVDEDGVTEENKKLFVITYSVEKLKRQGDLIVASDKRQILNFGYNGEANVSRFLDTATGVQSSAEQGYVMMREGSITALSTNLNVVEGSGEIEIVVMKNGEIIPFGNTLSGDGVQTDYDVQSNGVVTFQPGDVVSVYLDSEQGVEYKNVITMVEITTTN